MLNTIIGFNRCLLRMPLPWVVWVMMLMLANMIGPLFFLDRLEGRVVLIVFLISVCLLIVLYAFQGFTRILGAGHVLWLGLVPWLWGRLDGVPAQSGLFYWIIAVMVMNSLSLVIDISDVVRYLRGDRQATVSPH